MVLDRIVVVFVVALFLSSCASNPEIPDHLLYQGTKESIDGYAIVTGYKSPEKRLIFDVLKCYPYAVDGKLLKQQKGEKPWEVETAIPPGERQVSAEFQLGVYRAHANLHFQASQSERYTVKCAGETGVYDLADGSPIDFWVETSDGQVVSHVVRTMAGGGSNLIYVPIAY